MLAALNGSPENVRTLATMGANLLFDFVTNSDKSDKIKAQVLTALAEHGVTSSNIPLGFQSTLYFESE
jgi:hypothetical protein